jgi:hypothetical protein
MARFKDFGSGASNGSAPAELITFKLHDEEFTCRGEIPGKTVLNLVAKSSSENPGETAEVITGFFKTVLIPESHERFDALTEDPDRIVSMETLSSIIEWLVEQYTDRPTVRPEALPSGQ